MSPKSISVPPFSFILQDIDDGNLDNKDFYCNGGDDDGKVFISIGLSIMAKVRRPIGCLKCTDSQLSEDDHIIPGHTLHSNIVNLY